jgi:ligand-binding SRPBCC domain-containing protein
MQEYRLVSDFVIPRPRGEVFAFFSDAGNLERITPPWLNFRILTPLPIRMAEGSLIEYRIRLKGVPMSWRTLISRWDPPDAFVDEQIKGPYALWHHTHEFIEVEGGCRMIDTVRYALPMGVLGRVAHGLFVRRDLERIFAYRREHIGRIMGFDAGANANAKIAGASGSLMAS